MIFLDTNYLIRFFTNDVKAQAKEAKILIENEKVFIADIVIAETVYILETHYGVTKGDVCNIVTHFLRQSNIFSSNFAILSFQIYKNENISYYDCLLISQVLKEKGKIKTFDEKLVKVYSKYLEN